MNQFFFSARYDAALAFAAQAHRAQVRKGTTIPYIAHPFHVSLLLIRHGFSEDLAIAGVLHDVIEDCGVSPQQIEQLFGETVRRLIVAVSAPTSADNSELPWEERKRAQLELLRAGGPDVAALKAADAIHNARSILADYAAIGDQVWLRFKRGATSIIQHYQQVCRVIQDQLGEHPIALELAAAVDELSQIGGSTAQKEHPLLL